MDNAVDLANPLKVNVNIQSNLIAKLDHLRQQYPERYSKPVHVLASVDDGVDGECEQRLQQAKNVQDGERIILIPYDAGNSHWLGIVLKFQADGCIDEAEVIDP
ncbi:unnamed protein product, partial [Rotaria sp. Silwood1]